MLEHLAELMSHRPDPNPIEIAYRPVERPEVQVHDIDGWADGTVHGWRQVAGEWQAVVEWLTSKGPHIETVPASVIRPRPEY